jgi:5-methylcytosine-specific restriction endonuclease McrA
MKTCSQCEKDYELSFFNKRADAKDGLSYECKECTKRRKKSWKEKNPDKVKMSAERYREKNRDAINQKNRLNQGKRYVTHKKWREENRERRNATERAWRAKFPEKAKGYVHSYRKSHHDSFVRYQKDWRISHPLVSREARARRRKRTREQRIGSISYSRIRERDGDNCYLCNSKITDVSDLHFDHVVPLSKGGEHSESNIRVTHALCNRKKSDILLSDLSWYKERQ